MWKDLTQDQKAEVMDLYLSKGITSLSQIRDFYDSALQGNTFSNGGKIYIKPENRGKFTALKERTGHSSTWFKEHGTPAQKKMATFALNARKWQHPDGGYLLKPVIIKDAVDKTNVRDATEVNPTPSVYVGDSPEYQNTNNDLINAWGKGIYAVGRFLPYVKYVTDIVDWTSGDITDALQMAGNAISGTGTFLENDVKNTPIGTKRTVGRRPGTKHTIVVDQSYKDMGNKFAKGLKVAGKAISIPGLIGDVVQSTSDIKELIEAQKRHDAVRNSVVNSRLVYKNKFNN